MTLPVRLFNDTASQKAAFALQASGVSGNSLLSSSAASQKRLLLFFSLEGKRSFSMALLRFFPITPQAVL